MRTQQIREWFAKSEEALDLMQRRAAEGALLQQHLVANGFPATEMNALRAALKAVEEQLGDLQMAVYTGLEIPPITC